MEEWCSPIYAFFSPVPEIVYVNDCSAHEFKCLVKGCKQMVRQFLDTGDAKSTSNMRRQVKKCWGEDVFNTIKEERSLAAAQEAVKDLTENGKITTTFSWKGNGKVGYSHRQHTRAETCAEIVHWVSESL